MSTQSSSITLNISELFNYQPFNGADFEYFKLDLMSIMLDVFINVESRKILDPNKFKIAKYYLFNLNSELLKKVQEERFDAFCALYWHEPTNMTVRQFRIRIQEYFSNSLLENTKTVEENLKNMPDDKIGEYIQSFCYDLAKEMAPKLMQAWKDIKILNEHHEPKSITITI